MKVLHLVKTSVGATWALRQMRELRKLGLEVHVALPPDGPLVPGYRSADIVVHPFQFDFPTGKPWLSSKICKDLCHLVAIIKPDIIHSHFVGTTLTMRLALGKKHPIPRIFQVPGPLHLEQAFFRKAEIFTAGLSDYWIGSCRWTCQRYIRSGIPQDRLFLSYYGIDLDNFVGSVKGKLREELKADNGTKLVGMVAYIYAPKRYLGQTRGIKGHEDFIDALAICQKSIPDIRGVIIGGAWNNALGYERKVRSYAKEKCADRICFVGTRDDVCALYSDLDVVVHPSHSENVGGAAESLILGVPTVATNVGGFPDLIKHNETGWLADKRDPVQLAEAISEALLNPEHARDMALKGQDLAKRLFDVRETARQVLRIYHAIYSGK